jgi:tartrate dehydratase beta subunit/fumarate hydratase class I family protein
LVDDNVLLDGVMLTMRDDSEFKINMSGHDGNIYDAHAFVRFLMRTLEDKSSKN